MLEHIYEFEKQYLSPYACHSQNTKGRQFETTKSELRTEFQRDRDRIIHSKAFIQSMSTKIKGNRKVVLGVLRSLAV